MNPNAADWTAYVDGYCERLAPGLFGEPLNTISNVGFLLAAIAVQRQAVASAQCRRALPRHPNRRGPLGRITRTGGPVDRRPVVRAK
ncbi:hypothetical protein [Prauserella alba]|uniref:Uncharacterized protein n=1 Tax=Prauserella alba TaxID=176898 RepID=A0ABP4FXF2_9PSEU|nr:hypothetical protein [Prauserella alba]